MLSWRSKEALSKFSTGPRFLMAVQFFWSKRFWLAGAGVLLSKHHPAATSQRETLH